MKFSESKWCVLAVLTGLIFMEVHGHATPALPPASPPRNNINKVIVYPTSTDNIEQLRQKGITVVRNYGSYWLVQATDAQTAELTHLYGARAVKANDLSEIRLRNLSFDTTQGDPVVPAALRQENPIGKRLRLTQFRGPIVPQWLRQVQAVGGVELISYVPNNAYLIRLDQPAEDKLRALEGPGGPVQWIGAYHPYYKIHPELANVGHGADKDALVDVHVFVVRSPDTTRTMQALEGIGLVQSASSSGNQRLLLMTVPASAISQIAKLPDVIWIEKVEQKQILDEVQDLVLAEQTNAPGFGPANMLGGTTATFTNYLDFLFANLAGTQTNTFVDSTKYPIVTVWDTGLDDGGYDHGALDGNLAHPAFYVFGNKNNGSRVVYLAPPWLAGDATVQLGCTTRINEKQPNGFRHVEAADLDPASHGTMVASIVGGFDSGINILAKPCLQLFSFSNTWFIILSGSSGSITNTNSVAFEGSTISIPGSNFPFNCSALNAIPSGTTNFMIALPTGFANTCGLTGTPANVTFTNVVITVSSNACPTNAMVDVLYTAVVTNFLDELRTDSSGFQLGMGVSPFGLLGADRIMSQDLNTFTAVGTGCTFLYAPIGICLDATAYAEVMAEDYSFGFARIQNNSWADIISVDGLNGGQYDADAITFDRVVRDALVVGDSNGIAIPVPGPSPLNQEMIEVFACNSLLGDAGNQGNAGGFADIRVTSPATAKNIISVGSSVNPRLLFASIGRNCAGSLQTNSLDMYLSSAAGPTLDGRFKPEIVAPGASVYGAVSQIFPDNVASTNCSIDQLSPTYPFITQCTNPPCDGTSSPIFTELYQCSSGSSFAAPAVSGSIQLLWWYFQNRLTNEVGLALYQPSPAMAKAYVCNAARYLPISDPVSGALDTLPSTLQGMGELDLTRMFDGVPRAIRDESSPRAINVPLTTTNPAPQQTYFSQSGQSYEVSGVVASNGLPFRVTLAWIDPPGAPFATLELVNNLDLEVTLGQGSNAVSYKGNVFTENVSVPGGAFDTVNNMESVFLNPTNMLNGIAAVSNGTPFQVTVRAADIAGNGVPNAGEVIAGGSNTLNQDFALVVYNAATNINMLSDVPNLATNNSCQTAINVVSYPFSWSNTLTTVAMSGANGYNKPMPSPTAGIGGPEEFFRLPLPTAGTIFTIDMAGSDLDAVLSVWEVQVIPETINVRGECGALTEIASTAAVRPLAPSLSFTADGSNDYIVVAEGKNGATGPLVLNVNRNCASLSMTPGQLPDSIPGNFYSAQITVSGGVTPITFAVTSGTLPPGLTLDSVSGVLSGQPTATGPFTFTITGTDALGCTVSTTYTVTISCPTLTLSPPSLPAAGVGQPYSTDITVNGGTSATFSLAVGNNGVPFPGGTLTASGMVTGTPTTVGVYSFKVVASNTISCIGSAFYSIKVTCPTITVLPTSLPAGTEFVSYGPVTNTATGGTAPYTFSQTGGSLPAGMTLSTNGVISGTPTSISSTFTVTATDQFGCTGSRTYTLSLIDPPHVTLSSTTPSPSVVGQDYNQMISASGGIGTYSFALSGSLPAWLSTNTVGSSLMLGGVPTATGSYTFTVTATDSESDVAQTNYTINVTADADLGVSAAFSPGTVAIGSNLTCTVTVTNLGPSTATGVTITNALPVGATLVRNSSGCVANGSTLICDIGSLAAGDGATISYVVQPTQSGAISATASVTANEFDPSPANNNAVAHGTVAPAYTVAANSKPNVASIVSPDGGNVTVSLKGSGSLEVRVLGGGNHGPIDQIVLTGTGPSSSLTIQVKGGGAVNVGSITSDGSLKAISGVALNVTGAGIQVGGSLGTLKANALLNSALSVSGGVGALQCNEMSGSVCTVGGPIKTVKIGTYSSSKINAEKVGSVKLGTVNTQNGSQQFGIQVQSVGGTISVNSPHLKWKITSSSTQSTNDFQVVTSP